MNEQIIIKLLKAVLIETKEFNPEGLTDGFIKATMKDAPLWTEFNKILKPMQQEIDRLNLENEDYAQAAD